MRKTMFMLLAAALLVVTGCKKDDKTTEGEKMTFSAGFDNGGAKTEIDGLEMSWTEGDAVMINGKTFTADNGGASTTLSGDVVEKEGGLYKAYFPASIWDNGTLTLPATQTYNGTNLSGVNPMYAQSGTTDLVFSNLCSMVKLQLTGTKTVTEIRVSADQPLSGEFEVAESGSNYKAVLKSKTGNAGVTLSCGTGVSLSENNVFYVALPEGTYTNLKFKVVASDGMMATIEKANASLAANKLYELAREPQFETPVSPSEVTVTAGCEGSVYNVGGSVTVPDGTHTCEFGLVYSETDNTPTIEEGAQKVIVGTDTFSGTQSFTADITGLTVGTTYHVRAYAMIDGAAYSAAKDIVGGSTPLPMTWANGKSPKKFSVSATQTVYFSQGNLQYIGSAATPYWKFADHQFDFLGNNGQGSTSETADRDLFGWGTSGWNNGNHFYQPYDTDKSTYSSSVGYGYGPTNGTSYNFSLTGDYANADWGVNCAISNGGNQAGKWRTLTGGSSGEWYYLINSRTNAANLYGEGKVGNCTPGLIILPDDWKWEGDVAGFGASWKPGKTAWSNVYSYSDWAKMEAAGAVFLPAAGRRDGTSVSDVGSYGGYWSSSCNGSDCAYDLGIYSGLVGPHYISNRYYGFSVRLVSEN